MELNIVYHIEKAKFQSLKIANLVDAQSSDWKSPITLEDKLYKAKTQIVDGLEFEPEEQEH